MLFVGASIGVTLRQIVLPFVGGPAGYGRHQRAAPVAMRGAAVATTPEEAAEQEELERVKQEQISKVRELAKDAGPSGEQIGKFWVNQPGQLSFEVAFNRGDRIRDLRTVIEQVTGIPPEAQEIRAGTTLMWRDETFLEGIPVDDVWLLDDRDFSEKRGEYNPDPEEDTSLLANPLKIGIWIFAAIVTIFWVTQVAGVNPYGDWPKGPRLDWSTVPEDLRPGAKPLQGVVPDDDPTKIRVPAKEPVAFFR